MIRVSDEPTFVENKKLRLAPQSHVVALMPMTMWYNLLLVHMTLVDLVHMKRVCLAFASYKKLNKLIKHKTNAAFGGMEPKHWNRMAMTLDANVTLVAYIKSHIGKFFCFAIANGLTQLGAFSSKERIMDQFICDYTEFNKLYPPARMQVDDSIGKVQFSHDGKVHMYIGISKEIHAYVAVVPLVEPAPTQHERAFLAQYGFL